MDPFKLNKNKTTVFLLPIMFPNTTYDELIANYFEEAYVGILDEQKYDDSILLKFDYNNFTDDLIDDVKDLLNQSELFESQIGDSVLCYNISETSATDYDNFLHGRYTALSDEAKASIQEFWGETEESVLSAILNKNARNGQSVDLVKHYVSEDVLEELNAMKVTTGEIWPPPNVLIDELLFEEY